MLTNLEGFHFGLTRGCGISHQSKRNVLLQPRIAQNNNKNVARLRSYRLFRELAALYKQQSHNMFRGTGCTRSFKPCTLHVGKHPVKYLEVSQHSTLFQRPNCPSCVFTRTKIFIWLVFVPQPDKRGKENHSCVISSCFAT